MFLADANANEFLSQMTSLFSPRGLINHSKETKQNKTLLGEALLHTLSIYWTLRGLGKAVGGCVSRGQLLEQACPQLEASLERLGWLISFRRAWPTRPTRRPHRFVHWQLLEAEGTPQGSPLRAGPGARWGLNCAPPDPNASVPGGISGQW